MQENTELNLCSEIIKEMVKLEFNSECLDYMKNNSRFVEAYNGNVSLQKTVLTTVFYKILMNGSTLVPTQIRLALNIAPSVEGWLDDVKLVLLPFLKVNQEKFFVNNF